MKFIEWLGGTIGKGLGCLILLPLAPIIILADLLLPTKPDVWWDR